MKKLDCKMPLAGFLLACAVWLAATSPVAAGPTQDDVFKSIHDSVGKPAQFDSRPVILLAAGGGLVLLFLTLMSRRQQKVASPKSLNHPGRLMKEVLREVSLKPAELRQLKLLSDAVQHETGQEANPLTLLLCPSLLAKGLKAGPAKLDRKALAQVVRKMRVGQPPE
jgi:hypothetical protein